MIHGYMSLRRIMTDRNTRPQSSDLSAAESDAERQFKEENALEDHMLQAEIKKMDKDSCILYDIEAVPTEEDVAIPLSDEPLNPRSCNDTEVLYDRERSIGASDGTSACTASVIRENPGQRVLCVGDQLFEDVESAASSIVKDSQILSNLLNTTRNTEIFGGIMANAEQGSTINTRHTDSSDDSKEEHNNRKEEFLDVKLMKAREALASHDPTKASEELDVACKCWDSIQNNGGDVAMSVLQELIYLLKNTFKKQHMEVQRLWHDGELQAAADMATAAGETHICFTFHFPSLLALPEQREFADDFFTLNKLHAEISEKQDNLIEAVKHLYIVLSIDQSVRQRIIDMCQMMVMRYLAQPTLKSNLMELVIWQENQAMFLLMVNPVVSHFFCVDACDILKICPGLLDREKVDQLMCSLCFMLSTQELAWFVVDSKSDRLKNIISYSKKALEYHSSYDYKPALFHWTYALKAQGKVELALKKALEYLEIKQNPEIPHPGDALLLDVLDKKMQCIISVLEDEVETLTPLKSSEHADPDWIDWGYHQTGPQKVKQNVLNKMRKHGQKIRQISQKHSEGTELEESNVQSTPQVDIRASTRNDISGQKKNVQNVMGDDQEKTSAITGTSISSLLESIHGAVSKSCKGRSTSSSMPELGKKISRKKEDSNGLENIFPENTFYAKSVKILNETKNNFVSDLLQDQEVLIEDKSHVTFNENNDQEKLTIYPQRSRRELRDLMKSDPKSHKLCTMSIYSSQKAHCRLVDPEGDLEVIEINGRTRCGQAFSKDEVVIKLLGDKTRNDAINGEVLGVLYKHSRAKHPVFICQADFNCPHKLMKPQCKTVPKVKVLRPRNCRKPPPSEENPANFDIAIYNIRNGKMEFIRWKSLLWSDCNKYLYWVAYLDWRDDKLFPLGVVVHITDLQAASEVERMDMLLSGATVQHKIKLLYDHKTLEQTRQILDNAHTDVWKSKETMERRTNLTDKVKVFTIDPVGSKDLDDALSLEVNPDGTLSLGIHIADVSAFVKKDDPIDKEAINRRTSHYPPGKVPIHMLPDPLITDLLSLAEGKNRLALSLIFTFFADGSRVKGKECHILKTVVKSHKQYTYQDVQSIVDTHGDSTDTATLEGKIVKLLQIAMKLRKDRLGNGWCHQTLDWLENDMSAWEAHCLVEELMILANKEVASFLLKRFPDCTPLRCQKSPSDEQIEKFQSQFSPELTGIMSYLQQFICFGKHNKDAGDGESVNAGSSREMSNIPVQKFVWQLLSAVIEAKDSKRIASIMHLENLHPAHALAMYEWISIQTPAEFRCSSDSDDLSNLGHFALGNVLYAQFTSPIRRYLDLVLHRLVHNALSDAVAGYRPDEIRTICDSVNEMQSVAKSYEKYCKSVKLAIKLQKEPLNVAGIIVSVTEEKVELLNPFAQQRIEKVFDLNFSKLGVNSQPKLHNPDDPSEGVTLTWKKRLYDARGTHPHAKPGVKPNTRKAIGLQVSKLDPLYSVTQINLVDWKSLEDFVSKRKKKLRTIYPKAPADGTVIDVTSEVRDGELLDQHCSFSLSLKRGQCISVQLSAKQTSGLYQPEVQLCTIAPSVSLCVLHMDDPVQMFTRPARYAAKVQYQSVEQYQKIWIPILDMELAESIIKDPEEMIIINNVKVALAKPNEREESSSNSITYTGTLSLQPWFCDNRCIFLDPSKEQEGGGFITDYLCLRYTPCAEPLRQLSKLLPVSQTIKETLRAQTTWIGHGQVENVASGQDDRRLTFKLNHLTQQPPEEMFNKAGVPCTIELLHKSPGDRRIEEALSDLEEGSLAASLAKGYTATSPSKEMKRQRQIISKMKPWMLQKIGELDQCGLDLSMWDVKGQWFPGNNNNQREAIEKAIRSDFSIIHGPPGTGKTFTAIKLVYFFVLINKFTQELESKDGAVVRPRQVLFCGPSNTSVDVVANYLRKKLKTKCPRIVRVYGETIESKEYPKPTKWISPRLASCRAVCDPELKEIALHHLIRRPGAKYSVEIKQYDNLIKSSHKAALKKRKVISKLLFKASVDELKECEVILCTATSSSCPRIVQATNIFQCIVDECGMCPEPECLVPLVSSKAEQVVLIGDHNQLQPIISCKDAARLGLQKSLFERYAEMPEKQPPGVANNYTMLDIQYRMHPSICDFPSKVFYDHKLVTGASSSWVEESPLPIWLGRNGSYMVTGGSELTCPPRVVFCHVEGKEETLQVSTEDGNENSKSNKVECEHVVRIVRALIQQWEVDPRHINVMSQYNAQCTLLKQRLLKFYSSLNVKTVVTSQGGEWDYVVFSMVRSLPEYLIDPHPTMGWNQENLGFITDVHQVNVALTRAKKGLILLGNRNLLKCDHVLERLFEDYEQRGCIVLADEFPPPRDPKQIPQPVGPVGLPRRRNAQPVRSENKPRRPNVPSVGAPMKPLQPLWKNASSSTPYRLP